MTPTPHQQDATPQPLVVGLGEALFDCFPDRTELGGAPVNVAIHAQALLAKRRRGGAIPVTRVGDDDLGKRFFTEARRHGLDTRWVQVDQRRPTGTVRVDLSRAGEADYRFDPDSAWDALAFDAPLASLAAACDAVVFGTLAQRHETSRGAIVAFLEHAPQAMRVLDVNLRQDFYSEEVIDSSLTLARAAKLNEEELSEVARLLGVSTQQGNDAMAERLMGAYGLEWIALTRGAAGTTLYTQHGKHEGQPTAYPMRSGANSVGAGDACCAGLLCGKLLGCAIDQTLDLANRLGGYVASQPGATPPLPDEVLLPPDAAPPRCG